MSPVRFPGGSCAARLPNSQPIGLESVATSLRQESYRSYENQRHRASGLNLLVAAIILWNTTYLQRAIDPPRKQGHHPEPGDLAHLSPLDWEHVNLTGDHHWETSSTLGPNQFRSLCTRTQGAAAAA
jgi:Tn3 transposase DDE domain